MQTKGDIIPDRKMRKQRIALKNHGNITFTGSNIINYSASHFQLTAGNIFQTSDHSQRSSFAAAGRPQQNQALAFFYFQIQRLDDFSIAVRFTDVFKYNTVHILSFDPRLHKGIEYKFLADEI